MTTSSSAGAASAAGDIQGAFANRSVADAMHPGVIACDPGASARSVARTMASHHIHCVAVMGVSDSAAGEALAWKFLSADDLLSSALDGVAGATAGSLAGVPIDSVEPTTPLADAARRMLAERAAHLLVIDPDTQQPAGILSTQDLIGVLAGGEH